VGAILIFYWDYEYLKFTTISKDIYLNFVLYFGEGNIKI
jgi:hypothetical protein